MGTPPLQGARFDSRLARLPPLVSEHCTTRAGTNNLRAFLLNTSGSATSGTIKAQIPSPGKLGTSALLQLPDRRSASAHGIANRQDTRPMAVATVPLRAGVDGRVSIQESPFRPQVAVEEGQSGIPCEDRADGGRS